MRNSTEFNNYNSNLITTCDSDYDVTISNYVYDGVSASKNDYNGSLLIGELKTDTSGSNPWVLTLGTGIKNKGVVSATKSSSTEVNCNKVVGNYNDYMVEDIIALEAKVEGDSFITDNVLDSYPYKDAVNGGISFDNFSNKICRTMGGDLGTNTNFASFLNAGNHIDIDNDLWRYTGEKIYETKMYDFSSYTYSKYSYYSSGIVNSTQVDDGGTKYLSFDDGGSGGDRLVVSSAYEPTPIIKENTLSTKAELVENDGNFKNVFYIPNADYYKQYVGSNGFMSLNSKTNGFSIIVRAYNRATINDEFKIVGYIYGNKVI